MKAIKVILVLLAVSFVAIQFVRPEKNLAGGNPTHEIQTAFVIPPDVQQILSTSCYDCHSNTTRYPWYAELQPVGWWLDGHIRDAKRELNFSEFASYRPRRQLRKFEEIADEVVDGNMPLPSYTLAHSDARLSTEQQQRLIEWAHAMRDSLRTMFPVDSLERKQ